MDHRTPPVPPLIDMHTLLNGPKARRFFAGMHPEDRKKMIHQALFGFNAQDLDPLRRRMKATIAAMPGG